MFCGCGCDSHQHSHTFPEALHQLKTFTHRCAYVMIPIFVAQMHEGKIWFQSPYENMHLVSRLLWKYADVRLSCDPCLQIQHCHTAFICILIHIHTHNTRTHTFYLSPARAPADDNLVSDPLWRFNIFDKHMPEGLPRTMSKSSPHDFHTPTLSTYYI